MRNKAEHTARRACFQQPGGLNYWPWSVLRYTLDGIIPLRRSRLPSRGIARSARSLLQRQQ